jgi:hypothetical protein
MKTIEQQVDFWGVPDDQKVKLFERIKKNMNISPKAAEKDWWVCHVIQALFQLRCAEALTFKGGTSLSKAWGITERFSEDVDVAFDKSFFGLKGETRSARDRIRKVTRKYIRNEMIDELLVTLKVVGAVESDVSYLPREDSDADPTVLRVEYRSVLPKDPYIKEYVKLEFSSRSPREPRELREIEPFASQLSPLIRFNPTAVPTVTPVRTYLEKVFLLHEEFQKNYPRHKRMSRHLYDLYKMDKAGFTEKALENKELYASLVEYRSVFNAMRGIDYSGHDPRNLAIIPPEEALPLWEDDYRVMREQFIYGEAPDFQELISTIRSIQDRFHDLL